MIRFRPAILLAAVLVVSSCAAIQELPIPRGQTSFATAEAAFNILIERHVDKPTSTQLLNAALDAVRAKFGDDALDRASARESTARRRFSDRRPR